VTTMPAHHLGRTRIRRLLAAVGSTHATDPTPPQATVYDWRHPHGFNADQQSRLVQAMGQVAARMAEVLTRVRGGVCEVSLKALTQHYAGDLCHPADFDHDYCLAFAPDKGPSCGFASISPRTTMTWVTWLLGDSDSAHDPDRALSPLEESLLSDLFATALETFLAPLRAQHSLKPAGPLSKGQPDIQYERTEEVARIVFQVKSAEAGEPGEVAFILPCGRLAALAGKTAPAAAPKVTPQELSRALMEHLQELPVTVRATLASTTLPFQEILDLGPGDILLLDKPVDSSTELILDGRTFFHGRPARSDGQVAIVILRSEAAGGRQTGTAGATGRVPEPPATAKPSK
jgi:flagellar motor switch protein FliM